MALPNVATNTEPRSVLAPAVVSGGTHSTPAQFRGAQSSLVRQQRQCSHLTTFFSRYSYPDHYFDCTTHLNFKRKISCKHQ